MASSQARLLSLTARMHDIELKTQSIQNAKVALATQQDEAYERYCAALDATKIQVAYMYNGEVSRVDATYDSVCTYQENRCRQYALRNNKTNKLMVEENIKQAHDTFGNDRYSFALAVLGIINSDDNDYGEYAEIGIGTASEDYSNESAGEIFDGKMNEYLTESEYEIYKSYVSSGASDSDELKNLYNSIFEANTNEEKETLLNKFRASFYEKCKKEIYQKRIESFDEEKTDSIKDQINYYANLFDAIKQAGGCEAIGSEYKSGDDGKNWFYNMVKAGHATIIEYNSTGVKKGWSDTSVATSTNQNFISEVQDDSDLKKAEAEYEHELKIIDTKDAKFDKDLSKLETERSALKTEYEQIGKIIDENVQRTMSLFDA